MGDIFVIDYYTLYKNIKEKREFITPPSFTEFDPLMKNSSFYNDVIHAIEELYSSVTMRILQKRRDAYHSESGNTDASGRSLDITAPLLKYIDDVSPQKQKSTIENQTSDESSASNTTHPTPSAHFEMSNKDIESGMTKHFKERNNAALHPRLVEKLEHSIWEHIHDSIRHAKRGEADIAKMHADIASNAYQELAHYVSPEAHAEFALEIQVHLDASLKNQ
jgi:hypothetical protein